MPDIAAAIRALTYDEIELIHHGQWHAADKPILQRSISHDLRRLEATLGTKAKGNTILFAIAEAIDEALMALVEEP